MKTLPEAVREMLARAAKDGTPTKPVSYRALEAKADFMESLPPEMRALAMKEVERAIDLCESPIEQVALYQIAGHNFGSDKDPLRCRVLRQRGEIGYYPDRLHLIPQVKFGRYRVDFLLDYGGYLFAIECDGAEFHADKERDERRDRELRQKHDVRVLRAPGRSIWRDDQLISMLSDVVKVVARI